MNAPAGYRDPSGRHGSVVLPARPEQIADAYAAATAWRGSDPVADRAVPVLERELRARYGIEPADVAAVELRDKVRQHPAPRASAAEAATTTAVLDATAVLDSAAQGGAAVAMGGSAVQVDEAGTAPVPAAVTERERVRRRLESSGSELPARAVEARLTAAYGEGRPATDIRASAPATPSAAAPARAEALRMRRGR